MVCDIKGELQNFIKFAAKKNIKIQEEVLNKYLNSVNTLEIFTDGSVLNNGKKNSKGGYGVYINDNEKYSYNYDEDLEEGPATNQKTELLAILYAIKIVKNKLAKNIIIYSDSMYSINCLTKWIKNWEKNNWKSSTGSDVKNKALIMEISKNIKNCDKNISFVHVRSHRSKPKDVNSKEYKLWYGNDCADALAKNGLNL